MSYPHNGGLLTFQRQPPIMGVWWGYGRGMEKRKPDHDLANIKSAFADPKTLNRTFTAKQGADALGVDDDAVVAVIQGLSLRDFDKFDDVDRRSPRVAGRV